MLLRRVSFVRRIFPSVFLMVAMFTPVLVSSAAAQGRVVAIGDVHGDCDSFVAILKKVGLIDDKQDWSGGKTIFVQTGDYLDRGPKAREVMDLLMSLEKQAPKKGGKVIVLLGNHEVMNIIGDLRDVTAVNYAAYANEKSDKRRHAAYESYVEWSKARAKKLDKPEPVFDEAAEKKWMDAHPLGFVEQREAISPEGKYGKWLRSHSAVSQVGDSIFLHGGISLAVASWKIEDTNNRIRNEIASFDKVLAAYSELKLFPPNATLTETMNAAKAEWDHLQAQYVARVPEAVQDGKLVNGSPEEKTYFNGISDFLQMGNWLILHPDGPLWFRGYASWTDAEGDLNSATITRSLGVEHIVVGHTPFRDGRIHPRFNSRIFLIDTGMYSTYFKGGRASALEISNGRFTAIYPEEQVVLFDSASTGRPSSEEDLLDSGFLPGGGIFESVQGPQGASTSSDKKQDTDKKKDKSDKTSKSAPSAQKAEPAAATDASPRLAPTLPHIDVPTLTPPKDPPIYGETASAPSPAKALPKASSMPAAMEPHVWTGPDGSPSKIQSYADIENFLRTAKIIKSKMISTGLNGVEKLTLEENGVILNGAFRTVHVEKDMAKLAGGTVEMFFRDDFIFEPAAYELAKMLGIDSVPPAIRRTMHGEDGSLQIWVENVMMETKRQKDKTNPPDVKLWNRQIQLMRVFDNLVYNTDRNMGNILIDKNWKVWMIDHSRAFRRNENLREPVGVAICERVMWEKMKALTLPDLQQHLRPFLRGVEIDGIFKRNKKMLAYIDALIKERGEDKVIFSWDN
ncbi:MAG: metallophosphoesterase [Acidobacteria bacterium]|nr:metallophosphoesterase [Acidobacteriota bacterium]